MFLFVLACGFLGNTYVEQVGGTWSHRIPGKCSMATLDATLANSRCPGHAIPKKYRIIVIRGKTTTVVDNDCVIMVDLNMFEGATLLTMKHSHVADLGLLGKIDLTTENYHATIVLDRDKPRTWKADIPECFRDTNFFFSPPSSFRLESAQDSDNSGTFHTYSPITVRPGKVRIRFRYCVAPKSQGCDYKITQYRQDEKGFRRLPIDVFDLKPTGCWEFMDKELILSPECTEIYLRFSVNGEIGVMWIDDVEVWQKGWTPETP